MNIIHRDIKPSNIFINNLSTKLGDFGLSTMKNNTCLNEDYGSLLYLEPSIRHGEICTKAMDIFSLGIVIIELYSNFNTEMERRISLNDPYKYLTNCDLSSKKKKLIKSCITENIDKRITINDLVSLFEKNKYLNIIYT